MKAWQGLSVRFIRCVEHIPLPTMSILQLFSLRRHPIRVIGGMAAMSLAGVILKKYWHQMDVDLEPQRRKIRRAVHSPAIQTRSVTH